MSNFFEDDAAYFKSYIADPAKQINLGWTVTNFLYVASLFLGVVCIVLMGVVLLIDKSFLNSTKTKVGIVFLGWIGLSLIIYGLYGTISSFYSVVRRINKDVRDRKACSLFVTETAANAAKRLGADATLDMNSRHYVEQKKYDSQDLIKELELSRSNPQDAAFDSPDANDAIIE
jgi:hypothetical protein